MRGSARMSLAAALVLLDERRAAQVAMVATFATLVQSPDGFAPSAAIRRLFKIPRAIPIDCTNGTLAAIKVDIARANRAVSIFRSASPNSGAFNRSESHHNAPAAVRM